ncbi:MAG: hypothetical protein Q4D61_08685, partial [Cardiobacteriaceae bacterium]|nr:hypothetical protein [Cardiobacteriaceae bacterium]
SQSVGVRATHSPPTYGMADFMMISLYAGQKSAIDHKSVSAKIFVETAPSPACGTRRARDSEIWVDLVNVFRFCRVLR